MNDITMSREGIHRTNDHGPEIRMATKKERETVLRLKFYFAYGHQRAEGKGQFEQVMSQPNHNFGM